MHLKTALTRRPEVTVVIERTTVAQMLGRQCSVACSVCTQVVKETERVVPANGDCPLMTAHQRRAEAAPCRWTEGTCRTVIGLNTDLGAVVEEVPGIGRGVDQNMLAVNVRTREGKCSIGVRLDAKVAFSETSPDESTVMRERFAKVAFAVK